MDQVMFSVIIPLYNKEASIASTIQSVLNQTYEEFEVIIVNDGSTDGSLEVVEKFQDPRIRIINISNGGVSNARNIGVSEASYGWIAFLDGDDLWGSEHLLTILRYIFKFPDVQVFSSGFCKVKRDGEVVQEYKMTEVKVIQNYFETVLLYNRVILCSSAIVLNKLVLQSAGFFNSKLTHGEDRDLWARIGKKFHIVIGDEITSFYRIESENRSDVIFPDLENTYEYNIDTSDIRDEFEEAYYKKEILRVMVNSLMKLHWARFLKMKVKHKGFIKNKDLYGFLFRKISRKVFCFYV